MELLSTHISSVENLQLFVEKFTTFCPPPNVLICDAADYNKRVINTVALLNLISAHRQLSISLSLSSPRPSLCQVESRIYLPLPAVASLSVVPLCDHVTEKPEAEVTSWVGEQMSCMESPRFTRSGC